MDNAVAEFGQAVEAAIRGIEAKTDKEAKVKAERELRRWLDMPGRYRSPIASGHVQLPTAAKE